VKRDSPWDDRQRAKMLALAQYESDVHRCGLHKSVLDDPENNVMVPAENTCKVCAALDVLDRVKSAEDQEFEKKLGKDPDPKTPRPKDGRSLFLRPATPEELAERAKHQQHPPSRRSRRR
jgi:hypothetical protein